MALSDSADPPVFQRFLSKNGEPLASLPIKTCSESGKRYIFWSDIQNIFEDVVYLRDLDELIVLFMIGQDGELPLCIECRLSQTYTVIYNGAQGHVTKGSQHSKRQNHQIFTAKATCDSGPNLLTPLALFLEAAKEIYSRLTSSISRARFQQTIANARYYSAMLIWEIELRERTGFKALVNGMDRCQMLDSLREWEKKLLRLDYENICWNMLPRSDHGWNFAASKLFIVLPSGLDSWINSDPSTHLFRFYYLCDLCKYDDSRKHVPQHPQHAHLSNHQGYDLNRPMEFFEVYGDYVLRVLRMVKRGYSDDRYEVPPLDTFKIFWDCSPDLTDNHLTEDNIVSLVNKAIEYLQDLSPPVWRTSLGLTFRQSVAIKSYLDVQDGDNAEGNLHRHIGSERHVSWVCQIHDQGSIIHEHLEKLTEFIDSLGGYVDRRQAMIKVELGSTSDAAQFCALLTNAEYTCDIVVKLNWKPTQRILLQLFHDISRTNTMALEIDGITSDIRNTQDLIRATVHRFSVRLRDDTDIIAVRLCNYPHQDEHCIYFRYFQLRVKSPPNQPVYDWVELRDELYKFVDVVSDTLHSAECRAASRDLQLALAAYGMPEIATITIYTETWNGVFDVKKATFLEVFSSHMGLPGIVTSTGSVRTLTRCLFDKESDQELHRFVNADNEMRELDIWTGGRDVLCQVEFIGRLRRSCDNPLRLTLSDITRDYRGRIVAQMTLCAERRPLERHPVLEIDDAHDISTSDQESAPEPPMTIDFSQWQRDHLLSPLSDYHASFLDMATQQHPSILTSFFLDVSSRSRHCLTFIKNIIARSSLEHLVVVCTSFDPCLSKSVAHILQNIPWSTLKSLVLTGDRINEWIQLWPRPIAPRLFCLQIQGTGSVTLDLSHSSTLFVHQIVVASPLVELGFENIQLLDGRDWLLLIEGMDMSLQENS
ncbi:hypothetical protein CPC16_000501 [Podila verticillata]|nr:hypothetical protein CPC16_000501 [Podila verticillata]